MKDANKTKEQLISELEETRRSVTELNVKYTQDLGETKQLMSRYQSMFGLSPDGMITLDIKGVVTSCNSAFLKLSGFSEEEIVGKHFTKLPTLRKQDIPKYIGLVTSLLNGKKVKPFEIM